MSARGSAVDEWIDEILPAELDWRRLVRSYPWPSLALVALGGYLVGRHHGRSLVLASGAALSATLGERIQDVMSDPDG